MTSQKLIRLRSIAVILLLSSCGPNQQDYQKAAEATCNCMSEEKNALPEQKKSYNDAYLYALCTQNAERESDIDIQSEMFTDALMKLCPKVYRVHQKATKNAISIQE